MLSDLQFLPTEVQASLHDLLESGVDQDKVALLVDRLLHASEAKTTDLQMSIVRIEEALNTRVDRIGDRLAGDMQTRLGASNQMLIDIHQLVQGQEATVTGLWAEFQAVGERVSDNVMRIEQLERKVKEHDHSRDTSIQERQMLRQDMDESKAHRTRIQAVLDDLTEAVQRIEQLLEVAGNHEAGG